MLLLVTLLLSSPPPLAPGVHRCGMQWSGYSELCTIAGDGSALTITSSGPSTRFSGRLTVIDANTLLFDGVLQTTRLPLGYGDLTTCEEAGPYKLRRTGKRQYFRHTQTCKDMTTTYFDVFVELVDPAAVAIFKKLSALTGMVAFDPGKQACVPVDAALVSQAGDVSCERVNESGQGSHYYECARANMRLAIFDTAKQCEDIKAVGRR